MDPWRLEPLPTSQISPFSVSEPQFLHLVLMPLIQPRS
jgi:hypothetical protein